MYKDFNINENTIKYIDKIESSISNAFESIEECYEYNQLKVLKAFIDNKVSESDLFESTGYGYTDIGRDKIEKVYSSIFKTEDALVRQQIVSGTHAISLCLSALTKPNDNILSISGMPYDTIQSTLGINDNIGSLKEYNISFDNVELKDNDFDYDLIKTSIKPNTKLIMIQRSRGYSDRKPISIEQIIKVTNFIKHIRKDIIIFVDNCYCEFVSKIEPTECGIDIMAGSLIKNPGGSLAKSGGYIVGKKDLIERCAYRLTAPGLGKEVGINFNQNRNILQGLYMAPQIVYNALKIVTLFAVTFDDLGYETIPKINECLHDIVISIKLKDKDKLAKFCRIVQEFSPVDSYVSPEAQDMPGYDSKVIMAAGCFISGSSIELSCDAPMREPYMAFLQGGISYYQGKLTLMKIIEELKLI